MNRNYGRCYIFTCDKKPTKFGTLSYESVLHHVETKVAYCKKHAKFTKKRIKKHNKEGRSEIVLELRKRERWIYIGVNKATGMMQFRQTKGPGSIFDENWDGDLLVKHEDYWGAKK